MWFSNCLLNSKCEYLAKLEALFCGNGLFCNALRLSLFLLLKVEKKLACASICSLKNTLKCITCWIWIAFFEPIQDCWLSRKFVRQIIVWHFHWMVVSEFMQVLRRVPNIIFHIFLKALEITSYSSLLVSSCVCCFSVPFFLPPFFDPSSAVWIAVFVEAGTPNRQIF